MAVAPCGEEVVDCQRAKVYGYVYCRDGDGGTDETGIYHRRVVSLDGRAGLEDAGDEADAAEDADKGPGPDEDVADLGRRVAAIAQEPAEDIRQPVELRRRDEPVQVDVNVEL